MLKIFTIVVKKLKISSKTIDFHLKIIKEKTRVADGEKLQFVAKALSIQWS